MREISRQAQELLQNIDTVYAALDIDSKTAELQLLDDKLADPTIWQDNIAAQNIAKSQSKLSNSVEPWITLRASLIEVTELAELGDPAMQSELSSQLESCQATFNKLKQDLRFNGEYDNHDVLLSIHAGAGGTDAQDWAGMILRMYVRWAEQNNASVQMIDESTGEEAGI